MARQGAAQISAAHRGGRRADRRRLPVRHQHAPVRRALAALLGGAVGKDTVSRVWRKVQGDWDAWNNRPLADEPLVRLSSALNTMLA